MNPSSTFWISFLLLFALIAACDRKYGLRKDARFGNPRPCGLSRNQPAWWTVIVFASFITMMISIRSTPPIESSTLVLMGISIHKLQYVILKIVSGVWMIKNFCFNLCQAAEPVIPFISNNNLILIGISSGTYTELSTIENRQTAITEPVVQLVCDGQVDRGEPMNENSKWYYNNEGKWFLSGGKI